MAIIANVKTVLVELSKEDVASMTDDEFRQSKLGIFTTESLIRRVLEAQGFVVTRILHTYPHIVEIAEVNDDTRPAPGSDGKTIHGG